MIMIDVLNGIRFEPHHFLDRMAKSKKIKNIEVSHVNTIYSLCWVMQFRVALQATKKTTRYAGYFAGVEESTMTPGKLTFLPSATPLEVAEENVLSDKLTEDEAVKMGWDYNKRWIIRKYRNLNAPPILADYKVERMYKPMYIFSFYNTELKETKYKILDSLSGDLEDVLIK